MLPNGGRIVLATFCLDIALNCVTGRLEKGKVHFNFFQYFRFWFWFDLFVPAPELLVLFMDNSFAPVCLTRGLKVIRVIQILRLLLAFRLYRNSQSSNFVILHTAGSVRAIGLEPARFQLLLAAMGHLNALAWALLPESGWATSSTSGAMGRYHASLWWAYVALVCGSVPLPDTRGHETMGIFICISRGWGVM